MKRLPSTSSSSAPSPRSMKIGERPIERIARTGELTPPGRTSWARRYHSRERVSASEVLTDHACSDSQFLKSSVK